MITHQKQPTANSCTITCLAMILNKPVKELYNYYFDDMCNTDKEFFNVLNDYDVDYFLPVKFKNTLINGFMYLLCVPSLNVVGGLHHIVVCYYKNIITVYDPQKGNCEQRYYVWGDLTKNHLDVELSSWVIDAVIPINPEDY